MYASKSPVFSRFVARKVACLSLLILVCRVIPITARPKVYSLLSDLRHVFFASVGTPLYRHLHLLLHSDITSFLGTTQSNIEVFVREMRRMEIMKGQCPICLSPLHTRVCHAVTEAHHLHCILLA